METFSASLAFCAGNSPVTVGFPSWRTVRWSFDVFFDLRLNKRLIKQSWSGWFETPSCNYDVTTLPPIKIESNVSKSTGLINSFGSNSRSQSSFCLKERKKNSLCYPNNDSNVKEYQNSAEKKHIKSSSCNIDYVSYTSWNITLSSSLGPYEARNTDTCTNTDRRFKGDCTGACDGLGK